MHGVLGKCSELCTARLSTSSRSGLSARSRSKQIPADNVKNGDFILSDEQLHFPAIRGSPGRSLTPPTDGAGALRFEQEQSEAVDRL
ncbi:Hypothetical protein NTJ_03273 [Nesidiocoris tenuis]|uniref:Uncharacterized protein n=1 Tax=Nesidiocoris tenuis TaxID=355587 RepID=A0ABN7ADV4_9HEMI|nr:Hypothetical protein NTJ_03273 [Nesidiocoris tenuis]